jgi:hypothetical protein
MGITAIAAAALAGLFAVAAVVLLLFGLKRGRDE